jgi:ParB-like chromosome segregation protein Spo0J
MSLHLNPEYEKLLPQMSEEEFAELKQSIKNEGQHYPIIVNEDLEVLDGHHRFRAATELGIEPDFEVRKFEDKLHEKKFVIEANLRRRHLNNFQLVELAVPLLEIEKALAKKRQAKGSRDEKEFSMGLTPDEEAPVVIPEVTDSVAKRAGVSTRTFEKGKKILESASEDEKQKLREGKTSITKVYSEVYAQEHPKDLAESDGEFESPIVIKNKKELLQILGKLVKQEIFCPACKGAMFECSSCHKTLQELVKPEKPASDQ